MMFKIEGVPVTDDEFMAVLTKSNALYQHAIDLAGESDEVCALSELASAALALLHAGRVLEAYVLELTKDSEEQGEEE